MIDPSLKRPWRRRAQRLPTATMRLGCPTEGNPTIVRTYSPVVLLHAPQKRPRRRGFRPPVLSQLCAKTANACPPGTSAVDPQDAHAGEAELGFCRPPSLPLLGKACPLTRERILSDGEHGRQGVAPATSQSSRLREPSCLRCCPFHQTVTVPCCDVAPSRGDLPRPLHHLVQNWNRPCALDAVRCDEISPARHTQQMAADIIPSGL